MNNRKRTKGRNVKYQFIYFIDEYGEKKSKTIKHRISTPREIKTEKVMLEKALKKLKH